LQRLCLRDENFGLGSLPRAFSNFFSIFASFTRFAVVKFAPNSWLSAFSRQLSANPQFGLGDHPMARSPDPLTL
jgi:hypothetical protein